MLGRACNNGWTDELPIATDSHLARARSAVSGTNIGCGSWWPDHFGSGGENFGRNFGGNFGGNFGRNFGESFGENFGENHRALGAKSRNDPGSGGFRGRQINARR